MAEAADIHSIDPAAGLQWKIGWFVTLLADEWLRRAECRGDADLDDDVPF